MSVVTMHYRICLIDFMGTLRQPLAGLNIARSGKERKKPIRNIRLRKKNNQTFRQPQKV